MPPKRTAPQGSGARKVEEDTGQAQTESTTTSDNYSSNDNNDYYNEEGVEDEGFGSDVTVGNTKSGRPRLKPMRHHTFEFDRQAGQPLVPNRPGMNNQPHGPSTKIPPSQPFVSSQGHMPENPPSRYPRQPMHYPPGNPGQGDFSQYGSQPTNWSGMHTQQSMPGAWGSHAYSQYAGGSQAVPRSSDFYQSFPTQQSQPSRVDPKPAREEDSTPAQEEEPTPAPKADSSKVKLEAELADLKAQKGKRERENEIRRELDGEMQQLRDQLEKTKQEAYKEVELARLQGERDALKRFDEIRREEQERQRQLAEQRMELESEIRVKLETERLAEIFQKETKERQFQELQKQALESILEKLDDAVAVSQAKLLQDNETEKEPDASEGKKPSQGLLLSEMKTSITSHLRQSLVLSRLTQEDDHASSSGRESGSNSRPGPPHHQMERTSASDAPSSRSSRSSSQGSSQAEWTGVPPPVPDAPTEACDIQEEHDYMSNHSAYNDGDWGYVPGHRVGQHDSRTHQGERINIGYQTHEKLTVEDIIYCVTGAVMEQLRIPHWNAPIHRAPDDRPYDQHYQTHSRDPPNINMDADSFDGGPPYGDATVIYDAPDEQDHHEAPSQVSRPYKPLYPCERPVGAARNSPISSSRVSPHPLPPLTVEESDISKEDHVETPSTVFPKLLENDNSSERDADTDSDSASTADSDTASFHDAAETMTEYSTSEDPTALQKNPKDLSAENEYKTPKVEQKGIFVCQMELWKEKSMKS